MRQRVNMIEINREFIKSICNKNHLKSLALFGSVTTDSFSDSSDVDVLILFDDSRSFNYFDSYFTIKNELEAYWHRSVDLVVEKTFRNPYFDESVKKSRVVIYEQ